MKIFKSIKTKLLYQCFGAFIKSPMSTFKLILVKKLYPYYLLGYNEENIPAPQCFDSYSNSNVQKNDKFFDVGLAQSCHEHCHIQQKQEAFPTKAFKKCFIAWKNEIGQKIIVKARKLAQFKNGHVKTYLQSNLNSFIIRKKWDMIHSMRETSLKLWKLSHKLTYKN